VLVGRVVEARAVGICAGIGCQNRVIAA
jgi:hypothetical protein